MPFWVDFLSVVTVLHNCLLQLVNRFDVFRPMHEMWKGYMMQLVKNIG